jgi:hypothetical protein
MKSFNALVADFLVYTNDPNSTTLAQSLVNTAIHYVMNLSDWNFNKETVTYLSVAQQQDYIRPLAAGRVRYVNVYTGNLWYAPKEMKDGELWRRINYTLVYSDIPQYWFVSNTSQKISLFPVPSSAGNSITIGYTKRVKDLGAVDYVTGTVSAVAGTTLITGAGGAAFTKSMIGRSLAVSGTNTVADGMWFDIIDVPTSATLTVKQQVPVAISGATYNITELIPFMEGFEDIALFWALDAYYRTREALDLAAKWESQWVAMLDEMKGRDTRSTDSLIKKQTPVDIIDVNSFPWSITLYNP